MPTRQRANGTTNLINKNHPASDYRNRNSLHGWRKQCLYFLILFVTIISIINLTLTIWIIRVQDFGLHGMGKLHITSNGIRMDGTAEFMAALRAKRIMSRPDSPLKLTSRRNISISAVDAFNNVVGQITIDSNQIVLKNKKLYIQDQGGRTLLYADDKKIRMNVENMDITVPGGLNFESSVQTPLVQASDSHDLRLESLTKKLYMNAASGIDIKSNAHDINIKSLMDIKFKSEKGKIVLDAGKVVIRNLRESSVPEKSKTGEEVYGGIREVCICQDGTLFLAPPDAMLPCKLTSGVCST